MERPTKSRRISPPRLPTQVRRKHTDPFLAYLSLLQRIEILDYLPSLVMVVRCEIFSRNGSNCNAPLSHPSFTTQWAFLSGDRKWTDLLIRDSPPSDNPAAVVATGPTTPCSDYIQKLYMYFSDDPCRKIFHISRNFRLILTVAGDVQLRDPFFLLGQDRFRRSWCPSTRTPLSSFRLTCNYCPEAERIFSLDDSLRTHDRPSLDRLRTPALSLDFSDPPEPNFSSSPTPPTLTTTVGSLERVLDPSYLRFMTLDSSPLIDFALSRCPDLRRLYLDRFSEFGGIRYDGLPSRSGANTDLHASELFNALTGKFLPMSIIDNMNFVRERRIQNANPTILDFRPAGLEKGSIGSFFSFSAFRCRFSGDLLRVLSLGVPLSRSFLAHEWNDEFPSLRSLTVPPGFESDFDETLSVIARLFPNLKSLFFFALTTAGPDITLTRILTLLEFASLKEFRCWEGRWRSEEGEGESTNEAFEALFSLGLSSLSLVIRPEDLTSFTEELADSTLESLEIGFTSPPEFKSVRVLNFQKEVVVNILKGHDVVKLVETSIPILSCLRVGIGFDSLKTCVATVMNQGTRCNAEVFAKERRLMERSWNDANVISAQKK